LLGNDNFHNEAHYVASNISIFLNAEFVCSVGNYTALLWRGRQSQKTKNISFILPQNCQASASTKNI